MLQRKTFDSNDLNRVVAPSGFSENKGLGGRGSQVSRAHKTWSRLLLKDFLLHRAGPRIAIYDIQPQKEGRRS